VEFAGVRIGWLFPSTRVVPARDIKFDEENGLIRLEHPRGFVSKAPHSNPKAELAQVEKEEIDAYYGCLAPLRRTSDIKEMRPEDALDTPGLAMATATTDELLLHGKANALFWPTTTNWCERGFALWSRKFPASRWSRKLLTGVKRLRK
jgi:hypothetical protein